MIGEALSNFKKPGKSKIKFGIFAKTLLGTLIPLIVILTIVGLQLNGQTSNTVKKLDTDYLTAEAESASKQVHAYFQGYFGMADMVSRMDEVVQGLSGWQTDFGWSESKSKFLAILKGIQSADDAIAFTWIYNVNTKEVLRSNDSYLNSVSFDAASSKWYNAVMNSKKTITTGAYEDSLTNKMIVTIATPVYVNGNMEGIFGIDVLLDDLTSELAKIKIGNAGYVTVYDTDKNIIYNPDTSLIMKNISDIVYSDNIREALTNNQKVEGIQYTRDGKSYDGSTVYLEDIGYLVLGVLPDAEYQESIVGTTHNVVFWFAIAVVVLAGITIFFSMVITKSIKKLSVTAGKIADGDLQVKADISSRDEIGLLSGEINAITDRLKEYILYIAEITEVLEEIGKGNFIFTLRQGYIGEFAKVKDALLEVRDTISETLKSVVVASEQVTSGAEQVATGAQSQAQGAAEQASSVQELAATLQDISRQIDNNTAVIQETGKDMELVAQEVHEGGEKMKTMLGAMDSISDNSKKVGNIIKSIEDIAFQTNILALNAAVEAARAGQAGKGFAVVADEVRNLAAKTAQASKTTADLIQQALSAVENGKTIADETADSFSQVYKTVEKMTQKAQSITANSKMQDEAIKQTATGVDQISSVVQTNSATAEQSAAASEELSGQAQMLRNLIAVFKLPDNDAKGYPDKPSFEEDISPMPQISDDTKY